MMATGHVWSGLAVGLLTCGVVEPAGPATQTAWVVAVTGATVLPDWDSPGTRVAKMWGPVSGGWRPKIWGKRRRLVPGITDIVGTFCGGHRRGSHSILGVMILLAMLWASGLFFWPTVAVLTLAAGLVVTACSVLWPGKDPGDVWPLNLGASILIGWSLANQGVGVPGWLVWALALGSAVHILGDMITVTGCPLSWPIDRHRVSILPMRAGGPTERWIVVPILAAVVFVAAANLAGYDPVGRVWLALTSI